MGLSADGRSFHMRIAVLSDIHGNLHALDAVLSDVEREDVHEIWCLGDIVGYGADPDDAARACATRLTSCCAAITTWRSPASSRWRSSRAARRSRRAGPRSPAPRARRLAEALSPAGEAREVGVYHGSPRDPVWEYVLSSLLAELCFDAMGPRLGLVDPSDVALSFVRPEGEAATGEPRRGGDAVDLSTGEWILNPGSVGQPRDGDSRAAWLLLDLDLWRAQWRRTDYDVSGAQAAIRNARLPGSLAERLEYGQ